MAASFQVVALDRHLDRKHFKSGSEALDHYFHRQVSQDSRRRVTACFVALTREAQVAGFYTLASASLWLGDLPVELQKKLPRYPTIPAVRLGRLAVDQAFKGQGLGAALLVDALMRSLRSDIAAYAMVVEAKDERAAAFYQHHGFIPLRAQPLTLFLPLASVRDLGEPQR